MWKEKKLSSAESFVAPEVSYILSEANQSPRKLEPLCVVLSEERAKLQTESSLPSLIPELKKLFPTLKALC